MALVRGETMIWQFCYGPDEPKPYFHPVALPDGRVLTWNRPPDHVWHHGLWFSWKYINGANYWEPDRKTGKPEGLTEWANVKAVTRPDHTARITMDVTYRRPNGPPVLTEKRTVEVSAPDATGRYHFDWTSVFTAGDKDVELNRTPLPGEPKGVAHGGYAGLSVRLAEDFADRQAATTAGPAEFDEHTFHRSRAPALDYSGLIGGRAAGIAICDHPKNLNHPTPWYGIRGKPMSYLSPAVITYGPHTLEARQSFTLRYRVIVHPDRWAAKMLEAEYRRFVRESAQSK